MKHTISTIGQLGLSNAAVLLSHCNRDAAGVMEDMLLEVVDEPINKMFVEIVRAIDKSTAPPEIAAHYLKTTGTLVSHIAAEAKTKEEVDYLVHVGLRLWELWSAEAKALNPLPVDQKEHLCYMEVAYCIANDKVTEWALKSDSNILAMDLEPLAEFITEKIISGQYFMDRMYDYVVTMGSDGNPTLVPESEPEWPTEVFDELDII